MLLLYSHTITARLQYITRFLFTELMGLPVHLTIDTEALRQHNGPAINYSDTVVSCPAVHIAAHPLLFETGIQARQTNDGLWQGLPVFFMARTGDIPFDILAAAFYLISRYEEYLPHEQDAFGRFAHSNALAFRQQFLQQPLVEQWAQQLAGLLLERWPALPIKRPGFRIVPTFDIDMAWSYRHKGWLRNLGGALLRPGTLAERLLVLTGARPDPFDSYAWLHQLHEQYQADPVYFFLMAEKTGQYDKNISPRKAAMQQLVKEHAARYTTGLHPSWQSGDNPALLLQEKAKLEEMTKKNLYSSRQHYIRFSLPEDYERLIAAGFTDDYSMGYGSINGFRASVAASFYWYNLRTEEMTGLRIHPFCFMDANSYYEQQFTAAQALQELQHYYTLCRSLQTTCCTIWHNNFLGTGKAFKGWQDVYQQFVQMGSS